MTPSIWLVIPCAGVGSRFGATIPKQYMPLLGATVFQHTLARFLCRQDVKGIVIAHAADDAFIMGFPELAEHKVFTVIGGKERADSVLNAVNFLVNEHAEFEQGDWIAVHDAARPCVSQLDLDAIFSSASSHGKGAILAASAVDTIKYIDKSKQESAQCRVHKTLDREYVVMAQTPQLYQGQQLFHSLKHCLDKGITITDESSAIEACGYETQVILGSTMNIKITKPEDLALAEFYLMQLEKRESSCG